MHPIQLIAPCISEEDSGCDFETVEHVCAVTGARAPCVPRKALLKKGFTNEAILKAPLSDWVSVDAYRVLRFRPERSWSWICDGTDLVLLDRIGVREIVIEEKYPAVWSGYVTTSYKKHGSLWARVNANGVRFWRFEALDVDCSDHGYLMRVWERLNEELRRGFSRPTLESLACPPFFLKKVGVDKWLELERWARPIAASPLYRFLCYLLPSQKELADE